MSKAVGSLTQNPAAIDPALLVVQRYERARGAFCAHPSEWGDDDPRRLALEADFIRAWEELDSAVPDSLRGLIAIANVFANETTADLILAGDKPERSDIFLMRLPGLLVKLATAHEDHQERLTA